MFYKTIIDRTIRCGVGKIILSIIILSKITASRAEGYCAVRAGCGLNRMIWNRIICVGCNGEYDKIIRDKMIRCGVGQKDL